MFVLCSAASVSVFVRSCIDIRYFHNVCRLLVPADYDVTIFIIFVPLAGPGRLRI